MKKSIFIIFFLTLCLRTGYSQERSLEWIPFRWQGDSISGKYIEKAYMYVPVKIDDLPVDFTMQLDLGTTDTQFYGNPIGLYMKEFRALYHKLDSASGYNIFRDIDLHLGPVDFSFDVRRRHGFGEVIPPDSLLAGTPKHIGTIAPDLFRDQIVVIDYPSCRFAVADVLPAEYADLPAVPFELKNGIIVLPLRIDGEEQKLMFDTGSSFFQLATSKERALEIAAPAIVDSLSGPLWWGRQITFYGLEVNRPVELGGTVLEKATVYYDKEGLWEEGVFKPFRIWGLTGNACFFDRVVILDYKNRLFRIK